jgi:prepilin-type N-terminal cleavage/methylation domain-containing protein
MKKKNSRRINFKNNKGYMLIESLIAIAIFSIGFLAVATLVLSATRNNTNGNILTQANMLAREKTEELKSTTDLTELDDTSAVPETIGGIFTRSWTANDSLKSGTSREIEVTVSWSRKGKNHNVVLKTMTKGSGI